MWESGTATMQSMIYKKTMQKCWLKADPFPPEMMADLHNPISNNKPVNANDCTHGAIALDTYDTDNMEFSSEKEATIAARNISSSEDSGTQNHIPPNFDEEMNDIGELTKELNLQALENPPKDGPMFKDLFIGLDLSVSDIETAVHTWSNVEDNPIVHNAVFKAVIYGMDRSEEEEEGG